MPRDWLQHVDDILEAIAKIRDYVAGTDYEAFSRDGKTQDAVIRNLEIIGEAARLPHTRPTNPGKSAAWWWTGYSCLRGTW